MKNLCIGLAIGVIGGMVLSGISQVQTFVNDMRNTINYDVVQPVKKSIQNMKNQKDDNGQCNCNCQAE